MEILIISLRHRENVEELAISLSCCSSHFKISFKSLVNWSTASLLSFFHLLKSRLLPFPKYLWFDSSLNHLLWFLSEKFPKQVWWVKLLSMSQNSSLSSSKNIKSKSTFSGLYCPGKIAVLGVLRFEWFTLASPSSIKLVALKIGCFELAISISVPSGNGPFITSIFCFKSEPFKRFFDQYSATMSSQMNCIFSNFFATPVWTLIIFFKSSMFGLTSFIAFLLFHFKKLILVSSPVFVDKCSNISIEWVVNIIWTLSDFANPNNLSTSFTCEPAYKVASISSISKSPPL